MKSTDLISAGRKGSLFCVRPPNRRRAAVPVWVVALQLIAVLTAVAFTGCGKKGPPRPPGQEPAPAAVNDLTKTISGGTLILTWTSAAEKGAALKGVAGYHVYRSKRPETESDCQDCPLIFQRVAVIPFEKGESAGQAPHQFAYREPLENGYHYIYKVVGFSRGGAIGKDSNTVNFTY